MRQIYRLGARITRVTVVKILYGLKFGKRVKNIYRFIMLLTWTGKFRGYHVMSTYNKGIYININLLIEISMNKGALLTYYLVGEKSRSKSDLNFGLWLRFQIFLGRLFLGQLYCSFTSKVCERAPTCSMRFCCCTFAWQSWSSRLFACNIFSMCCSRTSYCSTKPFIFSARVPLS